jgi:hypothetical protein
MAVLFKYCFASAAWKSCRSFRVLAQESELLAYSLIFISSFFFFPFYFLIVAPFSATNMLHYIEKEKGLIFCAREKLKYEIILFPQIYKNFILLPIISTF